MLKYKNFVFGSFIYLLIFTSFYFLYDEYQKNAINIRELVSNNFDKILLIIFLNFLYVNVLNYRLYFTLKQFTKYAGSLTTWSKVFFISILASLNFFGSGHLIRIIHLKKKNVGINDYLIIMTTILFLTIITYIFCVLFEIFVLTEEIFYFLLIIIFIIIILSLPTLYKLIDRIIQKMKYSNFFLTKIKTINYKFKIILKKKFFFLKIIISSVFLHLIELIIFIIISSILITELDFFNLFLLFFLYFIFNKIPFFSNIPGVNEILLGYFGSLLGFYFIESAMINFLMRFFLYLANVKCYIFLVMFLKFFRNIKTTV